MPFNNEIKASDVLQALRGPQGEKGRDGADGIDGIDGIDGKPGQDGKDGIQGPQGIQGVQGEVGIQGPRGPQGPAGEDGRGIRKTKVNNKGHLIITYTDGSEFDAGKVKGDEGPRGQRGPVGSVINSGGGGGGSGDMTKAVYDAAGVNEQLVGLTASQTLTNKSGNISQWTNDSGYITSAPVDSVNGSTGVVVLDADDIDDSATTNKFTTAADISKLSGIAAGAEVNTIDSGDNVSLLTNDAGYLTETSQSMIVLGLNDSQSVDSLTDTAINFNTSDIKDTGFTHSTSTNPSRIQVDADGRYKIEGHITIGGTTGNYRLTMRSAVRVNGTTTRQYIDSAYVRSGSGSNESNITFLDVVDLSDGDYIEIVVARISSTAGNGTTTPNRTKFIMTKVG